MAPETDNIYHRPWTSNRQSELKFKDTIDTVGPRECVLNDEYI